MGKKKQKKKPKERELILLVFAKFLKNRVEGETVLGSSFLLGGCDLKTPFLSFHPW